MGCPHHSRPRRRRNRQVLALPVGADDAVHRAAQQRVSRRQQRRPARRAGGDGGQPGPGGGVRLAGARGFHMAGMADAEGFLGMACVEILVHGADAARGLGVDFTPPDDLCRRTASRLFPWAPSESPGWATLCWATGRGGLEGQEPLDSSWLWHCPPLSEWDGQIRTVRNLVAEWVLDDGSGRWRPVAP